jgi:hypothetical protein
MPLPGQPLHRASNRSGASLLVRWSQRPRRVPTVLAPALPALAMLAVITAGMIDPPSTGLTSQLHITKTGVASTWAVTPR